MSLLPLPQFIDGSPVTTLLDVDTTATWSIAIIIEAKQRENAWMEEEESEILVTLDWDEINEIKLLAL